MRQFGEIVVDVVTIDRHAMMCCVPAPSTRRAPVFVKRIVHVFIDDIGSASVLVEHLRHRLILQAKAHGRLANLPRMTIGLKQRTKNSS